MEELGATCKNSMQKGIASLFRLVDSLPLMALPLWPNKSGIFNNLKKMHCTMGELWLVVDFFVPFRHFCKSTRLTAYSTKKRFTLNLGAKHKSWNFRFLVIFVWELKTDKNFGFSLRTFAPRFSAQFVMTIGTIQRILAYCIRACYFFKYGFLSLLCRNHSVSILLLILY